MHIDLSSSLRRTFGAAPSPGGAAGRSGLAADVARSIELHMGVRRVQETYGPLGRFAAPVGGAAPPAEAPPKADDEPRVEPAQPDADADLAATEQPDEELEALAEGEPESPADTPVEEAVAEGEAPVDAQPAGVVNFGFIVSGHGSVQDHRIVFVDAQGDEVPIFDWGNAGGDFSAADWARVDRTRIGIAQGDSLAYGQVWQADERTLMVSFEGLVDAQGNRFSLDMQVHGGVPAPVPQAVEPLPEPEVAPGDEPVDDAALAEAEWQEQLDDEAQATMDGLARSVDAQQQQALLDMLEPLPEVDQADAADDGENAAEADGEHEAGVQTEATPLPRGAALPRLWAAAQASEPAPVVDAMA